MKVSPPSSPRVVGHNPKRTRRRATAPSPPPPAPFHAFIAYGDVGAAARAMNTINDVLGSSRRRYALQPMLWRFNQLTDAKWRDCAAVDATTADVVVLASTSAATLTPELEAWIGHFLARKRGRRATLVALFGEEDAWTISIEEPEEAALPQAADAQPQRLVA